MCSLVTQTINFKMFIQKPFKYLYNLLKPQFILHRTLHITVHYINGSQGWQQWSVMW